MQVIAFGIFFHARRITTFRAPFQGLFVQEVCFREMRESMNLSRLACVSSASYTSQDIDRNYISDCSRCTAQSTRTWQSHFHLFISPIISFRCLLANIVFFGVALSQTLHCHYRSNPTTLEFAQPRQWFYNPSTYKDFAVYAAYSLQFHLRQ